METNAALLKQLDETVSELLKTYRSLSRPEMTVYELWSAKDVLVHLTFWHESFARNLAYLVNGRKPTPLKGRLIDLNQNGVEAMQVDSLETVLERFQTAHGVIAENILNPALSLIPYRKGSRDYSPGEHLEIVNAHINQHLRDVRQALARGS